MEYQTQFIRAWDSAFPSPTPAPFCLQPAEERLESLASWSRHLYPASFLKRDGGLSWPLPDLWVRGEPAGVAPPDLGGWSQACSSWFWYFWAWGRLSLPTTWGWPQPGQPSRLRLASQTRLRLGDNLA